jgi:fructose-specific phosphotransferase system IIC component
VSGATFFRDEDGALSPFWRMLSVVAIFLVLWPPICGSVVWWVKFESLGLAWLAAAMIYAYLLCAPSALLAGIVHAVAASSFHHYSILVPIVAAALAAVLIEMVIVNPFYLRELADPTMSSLQLLLFASLIASLMCWWLTRPLARAA